MTGGTRILEINHDGAEAGAQTQRQLITDIVVMWIIIGKLRLNVELVDVADIVQPRSIRFASPPTPSASR